jgi:alkylation response protein AidB-like acyl-CoA dehydrogenase
VIALRANSADTACRAARSLACGSSRWVLLARDPSARCFSDLRADLVRIDRPVGDEEVFSGDPPAAVMAGGQRSIAPDRVDPNVDGLGLFVVGENMTGFTQGQRLDKVRHRARDTGQLVFDEVSVTIESALGKVAGQGSFII